MIIYLYDLIFTEPKDKCDVSLKNTEREYYMNEQTNSRSMHSQQCLRVSTKLSTNATNNENSQVLDSVDQASDNIFG